METREQLEQIVMDAAAKAGLLPALALGICECESDFDPEAESPAGAVGLFQLEPATALQYGVSSPDKLTDPVENAAAGCAYFADLLRTYGGNVTKALAAYNWGPGNIARASHVASGSAEEGEAQWPKLLPAETALYIQRVPAAMYRRLWPEKSSGS